MDARVPGRRLSRLGPHGVPAGAIEAFVARRDCLVARLQVLPDKPEETAETTLRALWHLAAGNALSAAAAAVQPLPALERPGLEQLDRLIEARLGGAPLAYLTGRQQFMGLELLCGREAFIPRKETEHLGTAALEVLQATAKDRQTPLVVDIGTGCGNLALAMAHYERSARVLGTDLSPDAVGLARRNVLFTGLEGRVEVHEGDFLAPFDTPQFHGTVDLLICNPPYISSGKFDAMPREIADHEPRLAIDGGPFGIMIVQRLIRETPRFIRSGGWLAFEIGRGQGPGILRLLEQSQHFAALRPIADAQGDVRAVLAAVQARP